jgi:hypothetical protein
VFGRRRKLPPDPLAHIDLATAPARYAPVMTDVVAARRRYLDLVGGLSPGPVRDRLSLLGAQVDAGVVTIWETVQRAVEMERVLATLDPDRVTREYKQAKRSDARPELVAALEQRFSSVQRLLNSLEELDSRLGLLEARLGGLVARAAEVALAAGQGIDDLDRELADLVSELGSVRDGLHEVS